MTQLWKIIIIFYPLVIMVCIGSLPFQNHRLFHVLTKSFIGAQQNFFVNCDNIPRKKKKKN